ncbi:MAG: hypothetical protein HQL78_10855 [Magnetococcales bacterium]|nr:hypothetical protein [Magnetococcales bacterium]
MSKKNEYVAGLVLAALLAASWPMAYVLDRWTMGALSHWETSVFWKRGGELEGGREECTCRSKPIKAFRMGLRQDQPLFPRNIVP